MDLNEKVAFAPLAAVAGVGLRAGASMLARRALPAAAQFAWQGTRALAGVPKAGGLVGAARAGRTVGTTANAVSTAAGMASMVGDLVKPSGTPQTNSTNQSAAAAFKGGSLQARVEKIAFGPSNAVNIASYASMMGAEILPHDHPWHARLEALGLGGLAATTAANMIQAPQEETKPGLKDLAGLALFSSALNDRTKHAAQGDLIEKQALLGLALSGSAGFAPEVAGYAVGRSHQFTPEEAEAAKSEPLNLWASMMPGYLGWHLGRRARAANPEIPERELMGFTEHGKQLREFLTNRLQASADALRGSDLPR